jgi:type VI protein secretion system component Hcp
MGSVRKTPALEVLEDRTLPSGTPYATLQLVPLQGPHSPQAVTLNLDSYQFGFHNTATFGPVGVSLGRASFDALDVTTALDSSAHDLFLALTQGKRYPTANLTQYDASGNPVAVWALNNVFVTDELFAGGGSAPTMELKFAFGGVREATSMRSVSWNQLTNSTAGAPGLPTDLTLSPLPSPAATGLTLQLTSDSADVTTTINLTDFRFGFRNPATVNTGGVTAGRASFDALDVTAAFDGSSPGLLASLTTGVFAGSRQPKATLIQRDSSGQALAAWVLDNVHVTDDVISGADGGLPGEELKIAFGAVTEAAGTRSGVTGPTVTQSASWSRVTNTASGPVLPAGLTLGALPGSGPTSAVLQLFTGAALSASTAATLPLGSFQFGLHNTGTAGSGTSGTGAGRATFEVLDVTTALSGASPALFAALTSGAHYARASLIQRDAAGHNLAVWDLGFVFVTGDVVAGSAGGLPGEELTFAYGAVRQIIDVGGNPDTRLITTWSQVHNSSTSLDIPVEVDHYAPAVAVSAGPFTYDGTAHPATATATGVFGSAVSGTFSFTYYTGTTVRGTGTATAPTNAGTYTVVAHFTSADPDYVSADSAPLTFTVARATLTITASANHKTYGQTASDTGTVSGLADGDGITVNFVSAGDAATAAVGSSHYAITARISDPSGRLSNYIIHETDATLTVDKAPLTVTADDKTKIQGQANPPFTASYSGFVLGQGPGVLGGRLTFRTTAKASSPPGTYPITPSGLTSANYAITFVDGTLTIFLND